MIITKKRLWSVSLFNFHTVVNCRLRRDFLFRSRFVFSVQDRSSQLSSVTVQLCILIQSRLYFDSATRFVLVSNSSAFLLFRFFTLWYGVVLLPRYCCWLKLRLWFMNRWRVIVLITVSQLAHHVFDKNYEPSFFFLFWLVSIGFDSPCDACLQFYCFGCWIDSSNGYDFSLSVLIWNW